MTSEQGDKVGEKGDKCCGAWRHCLPQSLVSSGFVSYPSKVGDT
jgi:hypothetical protein